MEEEFSSLPCALDNPLGTQMSSDANDIVYKINDGADDCVALEEPVSIGTYRVRPA
jgi:hypothetical protein